MIAATCSIAAKVNQSGETRRTRYPSLIATTEDCRPACPRPRPIQTGASERELRVALSRRDAAQGQRDVARWTRSRRLLAQAEQDAVPIVEFWRMFEVNFRV